MSDSPKRPKFSRPVKLLAWSGAAVLTYTIAGLIIVPAVIKSQMLKRLPPIVRRQVAVRQVAVNPFTLALTVRGLALTESNGEAFAGLDQLHVQFQALSSLSHHAWVFQDVTLTHPSAHIIRRKDGGFNFDNILQSAPAAAHPAAPAPPQPLPAVIVEMLRVDGSEVQADDLTPEVPFHDKLDPINLQVTGFTTRPNISSPFSVSVTTDAGENIAVSGNVTVQPLQSSGRVKASGLDLKRYAPYLAAFTTAELLDGKLDAGADYVAAFGANGLDATVTNGTALLRGLAVKAPDSGETVVSIPSLTVDGAEASLGRKMARVKTIKSAGGSLLVRQNRDGTINLLALLKNPPSAPTAMPAAAPWSAQVDEMAFDTYTVAAEDQKPAHAVKISVTDLAFKINGFSTASNAPISATVSMRLNGQGSLAINGKGTALPPGADLQLDLEGLDLPPFQPYLAGKVNLAVTAGRLDVHGRARYTPGGEGPLASFIGDVAVTNLATADSVHFRDLLKLDLVAVKGIDAAFQPNKLHVGEIELAGLRATIILDTNRQANVLAIFPPQPKAPASAAPSPAAPLTFPVSLGALVFDKASLHFIDQSIEPNCVFDVLEFGGAIKGLSSTGPGPATVDLQGKVDQFSPFSATGTVNPLAKDISLNVAVSMKNFELTPFTPYMEKYGGYPLNKGKLLLELQYAIAQRKLAASNKVVIADLTLGPRNSSPDAVHLPIKLGIALLKDRNGKIDLDVPVSGSLDDPTFKIGPIVWKVIDNLLEKAATSPFTLLGKLLGGGGEELSYVDFPPGEATLAPAEQGKVEKLAKALYARPALNLQIAGATDPASDSAALARLHLERRVKAERARELTAAGQPAEAVDTMKIDPADYPRLLQALYQRTFPTNAAVPALANSAAPTQSPAPPALVHVPSENSAASSPAPQAVKGGERLMQSSAPTSATPALIHVPPDAGTQPPVAHEFVKGGERLMRHGASTAPRVFVTRVQGAQARKASPPSPAASPAGQAPPAAPDVGQMEQRLLAQITVTDSELHELMEARAKAVQRALLESGKVEPERIFILAPKPVNAAAKGEARVNLSLE